MSKINKDSRLPLYHQLVDIITNDIEEGALRENDKLMSEREFCELYDISRATVRQAIQELEKNGYLYKQQGKGTFVSPKAFKQDLLKFYSFTDEMIKLGKQPRSELMSFDVVDASRKVARKLGITEGEKVYQIIRLRLADEEPMMYERTFLPVARFPELSSDDIMKHSMYSVFRNNYNVKFTKAEEKLRPVITKEAYAELLEIDDYVPSMRIERLTYEGSLIIEYTIGIARGDRFEYRVVLGNE